jgi:hypothetical protein
MEARGKRAVLVYAPEDFNNVCVLARTLEVLGVGSCFVYDPHRLSRARYGKSHARRLRTTSPPEPSSG